MSKNPKWVFKTDQVLSNESATIMPIILKEYDIQLREQIAKEIEAELCDTPNHGDFHQDWTHEVNTAALKLAANIARGKNETRY